VKDKDDKDREKRVPLEREPRWPETPFLEDEIEPYFLQEPEKPEETHENPAVDPEEDWFWRDPENFWLEEGMWPWPEPNPKRETRPKAPEEVEPRPFRN